MERLTGRGGPAGITVCAALALCGCAAVSGRIGLRQPVTVSQLAQAPDCGGSAKTATVHVLNDVGAVGAFELARGFRFHFGGYLPAGPFAIVEMGVRTHAGASLAVSSHASLVGDMLQLTATFFPPADDAPANKSDACVLVSLPADGGFDRVAVYDPTGVQRGHGERPRAVRASQRSLKNSR